MFTPSLERVTAAWEGAAAEQKFWEQQYEVLLDKYPDHFVAVYNGAVIAANPDLAQLVQILEAKGRERSKVWVRFITADPRRVLL